MLVMEVVAHLNNFISDKLYSMGFSQAAAHILTIFVRL